MEVAKILVAEDYFRTIRILQVPEMFQTRDCLRKLVSIKPVDVPQHRRAKPCLLHCRSLCYPGSPLLQHRITGAVMWRLKVSQRSSPWLRSSSNVIGRQEWEFDPDLGTPEERALVDKARREFAEHRYERQHSSDLIMRIQYGIENPHNHLGYIPAVKVQEGEDVTEEAIWTSVKRAVNRVCNLQADDGHWPGDYGGLLFLMPGLLITLYVSGTLNTVLPSEHQKEMLRYIYNHQNEDGGWGLHIEGHSTMLCSALNYVALRLLGESPDGRHGAMEKSRKWILDHGGATFMAAWGKFWLSYGVENPHNHLGYIPAVKLQEGEDVTEEAIWTSVKRDLLSVSPRSRRLPP